MPPACITSWPYPGRTLRSSREGSTPSAGCCACRVWRASSRSSPRSPRTSSPSAGSRPSYARVSSAGSRRSPGSLLGPPTAGTSSLSAHSCSWRGCPHPCSTLASSSRSPPWRQSSWRYRGSGVGSTATRFPALPPTRSRSPSRAASPRRPSSSSTSGRHLSTPCSRTSSRSSPRRSSSGSVSSRLSWIPYHPRQRQGSRRSPVGLRRGSIWWHALSPDFRARQWRRAGCSSPASYSAARWSPCVGCGIGFPESMRSRSRLPSAVRFSSPAPPGRPGSSPSASRRLGCGSLSSTSARATRSSSRRRAPRCLWIKARRRAAQPSSSGAWGSARSRPSS